MYEMAAGAKKVKNKIKINYANSHASKYKPWWLVEFVELKYDP